MLEIKRQSLQEEMNFLKDLEKRDLLNLNKKTVELKPSSLFIYEQIRVFEEENIESSPETNKRK